MKQPWEWDEDDLLGLVANQTTEGLTLEYKACDALDKTDSKKNEVSKDVSAFANSAGGTIVYGMVEQNHLPIRLDAGYDPALFAKEWVEQVVHSRIQRRIDGIRIAQVALNKSSPGKVAYVVSIPQSMRAAHMAHDHRYYKRFNFAAIPMEDYEVRDVSRRSEAPDLDMGFYFYPGNSLEMRGIARARLGTRTETLRLYPEVVNRAITPADYAVIELFIDSRLNLDPVQSLSWSYRYLVVGAGRHSVSRLRIDWNGRVQIPFLEGVPTVVIQPSIGIAFPHTTAEMQFVLGSYVNAPGMSRKEKLFVIRYDDVRGNAQIVPVVDSFVIQDG